MGENASDVSLANPTYLSSGVCSLVAREKRIELESEEDWTIRIIFVNASLQNYFKKNHLIKNMSVNTLVNTIIHDVSAHLKCGNENIDIFPYYRGYDDFEYETFESAYHELIKTEHNPPFTQVILWKDYSLSVSVANPNLVLPDYYKCGARFIWTRI